MVIQLTLPDNVEIALRQEYGESLERRVLEDLAAQWFSQGLVSSGKVAEILGLTWSEAQAFLKCRGATDQVSAAEVFREVDSLRAAREAHPS